MVKEIKKKLLDKYINNYHTSRFLIHNQKYSITKNVEVKIFKLADPVHNNDLFELAEKEVKQMEAGDENINKYKTLIKLYDQADIINDIV